MSARIKGILIGGALGGLIGAAIFADRDPGPPEGYGGYPGGYQPPPGQAPPGQGYPG